MTQTQMHSLVHRYMMRMIDEMRKAGYFKKEEKSLPLKHGQKNRYKYATASFCLKVFLCMAWKEEFIKQIIELNNSKLELIERTRRIKHLLPQSFLTELSDFEKRVDRIRLSLLPADDKRFSNFIPPQP